MAKCQNIEIFDFNLHENSTFLVGGYRIKKRQEKWIFGENPKRGTILYNIRFTLTDEVCRNGSMSTGELPDFVILYDYTDNTKVRLFECKDYSIHTFAEMKQMKYPIFSKRKRTASCPDFPAN